MFSFFFFPLQEFQILTEWELEVFCCPHWAGLGAFRLLESWQRLTGGQLEERMAAWREKYKSRDGEKGGDRGRDRQRQRKERRGEIEEREKRRDRGRRRRDRGERVLGSHPYLYFSSLGRKSHCSPSGPRTCVVAKNVFELLILTPEWWDCRSYWRAWWF